MQCVSQKVSSTTSLKLRSGDQQLQPQSILNKLMRTESFVKSKAFLHAKRENAKSTTSGETVPSKVPDALGLTPTLPTPTERVAKEARGKVKEKEKTAKAKAKETAATTERAKALKTARAKEKAKKEGRKEKKAKAKAKAKARANKREDDQQKGRTIPLLLVVSLPLVKETSRFAMLKTVVQVAHPIGEAQAPANFGIQATANLGTPKALKLAHANSGHAVHSGTTPPSVQ